METKKDEERKSPFLRGYLFVRDEIQNFILLLSLIGECNDLRIAPGIAGMYFVDYFFVVDISSLAITQN